MVRHWLRMGMLLIVAVLFSALTQAAASQDDATEKRTLIWVGCGITKKAFMAELAKAYEAKTGVVIALNGGGATKGIREVAAGNSNLGGACRHKLDDAASERKAKQIPVAWDALAVVVHQDNPVENITLEHLRGIYLGTITNWKQVGGNDAPIELYVRRGKNSGVGRTLRELVFHDYDQQFTKNAKVVKSSGPAEKAVVKGINAITTTGISSAKRRDVKVLRLEGKEPSYDNIKSGDYLLYRPLYIVVNNEDKDPDVKKFVTFALSKEGRDVIRSTGTVPYLDGLALVMKQVEQYDAAAQAGL